MPTLELDLSDPFVCGVGFFGDISGGVGPYELTYSLRSLSADSTLDLGEFVVGSAGAYASPTDFINPLLGRNDRFSVSITLADGTGQLISRPDLFVADVRTPCSPASAPSEQLSYPGPFTLAPPSDSATGGAAGEAPTAVPQTTDTPVTPPTTGAPLANTGSDAPLLATLSMLLLSLGGVLMVASRREDQDAR